MIIESLDIISANKLLPKRDINGNKGTFGKVLLICGSKNMVGCCALATEGALRSGAGLVTLAFPDCLYTALTSRLTENLFLPLSTNNDGCISSDSINTLSKACKNSDVIMVGCGLGTSESVKELIKALVTENEKPLIMDADALNCLSEFNDILLNKKCEILLTPHPGEMSRLCGLSVADIEENREEIIVDFCKTYKVNVLLKGHETCITDGEKGYLNRTGNPGMAVGGSGDVLAGIIVSLLGQKIPPLEAAAVAAWLHGTAGDICAGEIGQYGMLPTDMVNALPRLLK